MAIVRWNPVRDLPTLPSDILGMQREINKMFDQFFRGGVQDDSDLFPTGWNPMTDVVEHENEYQVRMELPGVKKEEVKITVQENVLTIRGDKKQEQESENANYHRVERSYGSFQRSFTLPSQVKADKIEASYKDGILNITLPKAEESKPRQIDVKVK